MAETILQQITRERQQSVTQTLALLPSGALEQPLPLSNRSLFAALNQPAAGFILECKKASPSKGVLASNFHASRLAQHYQPYAAAISVLTEPDYFQGCFEYLRAVASSVPQPVLCKDFISTLAHVRLARYFGADAILLMLSVLEDDEYQQLAAAAAELQLDVLTEVSTEAETNRAVALGAKIIGINNRNLHDLSIDPNRSKQLSKLIPSDRLVIAESGYSHHAAVRDAALIANGFLVGSALSGAKDVSLACRGLIYGQHKVCGLTRAEDAEVAAASGAYYGGLIFAQRSPRCISLAQAQAITQHEPNLAYVAVVVEQTVADIVELAKALPLTAVQLHGSQAGAFRAELRVALDKIGVTTAIWQALSVTPTLSLATLSTFEHADKIVLDNGQGGSGETFDWRQLSAVEPEQRSRLLLAGGLRSDNLDDAIRIALNQGFHGFDFNSGVEFQPGVKNAQQVQQVFHQLRQYGRKIGPEAV